MLSKRHGRQGGGEEKRRDTMDKKAGKEKRYWVLLRVNNNVAQFSKQKYWDYFAGKGVEQFVEVPVRTYKVRIEGFEDLELFAHQVWIDGARDKGKWHVVEATSGFRISEPMRTKAQAIQSAKEVLLSHGATKTQEAIKARIERYGSSPRYQNQPMEA
jgi:hypothetical protein